MSRARLAPGLALAALAALARHVHASPAQVIIIRHAEKPADGPDLDADGKKRAQALVGFFQHAPSVTKHGPPVAIYAMDPGDDGGSRRTIETVTPLAEALGLKIVTDFRRKQIPRLVREILDTPAYKGKTVLVCWERTAIPDIAAAFGWNGAPPKWPDALYDRAWVLNLAGDDVFSFADVPQRLLPDDDAN